MADDRRAEEQAIHDRLRRERQSREALIASWDIDPAETSIVAERIRRLEAARERLARVWEGG